VPNIFDDFLEELRRRQAQNEGGGEQRNGGSGDPADEPSGNGRRKDETMRSVGPDSDDTDHDDDGPSRPVFRDSGFRGGSGGSGRGPFGPSGDLPELKIGRGWVIAGVVIVALLVLLTVFALTVNLATDALWFQSVGYGNVFWTRLGSQILYFIVGAAFAFVVIWINLYLAGRFIPKGQLRRFSLDDFLDRFSVERYLGGDNFGGGPFGAPARRTVRRESVEVADIGRPLFWGMLVVGALVALTLGGLALGGWNTIQLFMHRVPFGQPDQIFGKDVSFFMFELPFYRLLQQYANTLLLITLSLAGIRYLVAVISGAPMPTSARAHLGILAALYLWSAAIGYQLDRYELVYSNSSGIFQGVGYTDANARMVVMNVMTVLTAFVGCFVAGFAITRWRTPLALTLVFWAGAFLILEGGYPQIVQRFSVDPNQQVQEQSYITDNINATRAAFNLTGWSSTASSTLASTVTPQQIQTESSTIQNVRLWDIAPLAQTLDQLQVIRTYYNFSDVDTDRYLFSGTDAAAACAPATPPCVRQVMIAAREFSPDKYAAQNSSDVSWVNLHISYTHGVGLAMVPVNEVAAGGQPNLVVSDLPPVSSEGAPVIKQPRIYFGTNQSDYVIVDAASQEFDYPSTSGGGSDAYTNWTGTNGIKLDTPLSKLLFAARFGDLNLLISNQITGSSQLLFHRAIQDRIGLIAPFLRLDKDPYLVVTSDGQLDYIQDAYTTSAAYPDANPYTPPSSGALAGDPFNYIRNSVKIVMNAYDGTMSFYVSDPTDPIIQAWQGVFPSLFQPLSAMPSDLRGDPANPTTNPGHLRYPEDMFNAQTTMFEKYHVTDPVVFFKNGDVWSVPQNAGATTSTGANPPEQLPLEAYYVQMRMPDSANPEFLLLQPMAPSGRKNMIAWVAAHNDPATYGQVSVVDFPVDANVFGPEQMEGKIASNPQISQQITLWAQGGSQVILGNLLVLPVQNSLLYVEPVYLVSTSNSIPAFVKVVVGTPSQVVWGDSLADALNQIYAGAGSITSGSSGAPGATPTPGTSSSISPPTATPASTSTPGTLPSFSTTGSTQELVAEANAHFEAAQAAAQRLDWATYGSEMKIVQQLLTELENAVGTPAPSGH
jgi:uncharacterized membrane protein (UPF0182 family)